MIKPMGAFGTWQLLRAVRRRAGYAYVTNRIGTYLTGAPCDVALRDALYAALQSSEFIKGR